MNILITSAGRRVSLVRGFMYEIKKKNLNSKIFTTDMNPGLSSACNVSNGYFLVSKVTDSEYIGILKKICVENEIKLIIPTIDTELLVLSENKDDFKKNGIEILVSDVGFVKICRDKRLTHKFFDKHKIKRAKDIDPNNLRFPLFLKPYDGSCSKDTFLIKNRSMLTEYHLGNIKLMYLEYLDPAIHKEFTLDLYYDKNSELKSVVPRERLEVRAGEVNKGITRKNKLVEYIEKRLPFISGAVGCITLQVFINSNNNDIYGIEINPRFGGGYPLSRIAGANYTKWIIEEYLQKKKIEKYNDWEDNLLMLRYDAEIIVNNYNK